MPNKSYPSLINEYRFEFNRDYSIYFDSKALQKWFLNLLAYRCTICNPIVPFSSEDERNLLHLPHLCQGRAHVPWRAARVQ